MRSAPILRFVRCLLRVLGIGERPAEALDQRCRSVRVAQIRGRHALLQLKRPAIAAERTGFVLVGLGADDHAWHAGLSVEARTAHPGRVLAGRALWIDTRNTGWPRLISSAQAAVMRSSRTPGQDAMSPALSGWPAARARRARSS